MLSFFKTGQTHRIQNIIFKHEVLSWTYLMPAGEDIVSRALQFKAQRLAAELSASAIEY